MRVLEDPSPGATSQFEFNLNSREARESNPARTPEAPDIDFEDRGAHLDPCTPRRRVAPALVPGGPGHVLSAGLDERVRAS